MLAKTLPALRSRPVYRFLALEFAGASAVATDRARTTIEKFPQYLEENKDEITAIQLLYSRRRGQSPSL